MEFDVTEQNPRVALEPAHGGELGRQLLRQRMFPRETLPSHIGRYVILRFVGAGGMGQVFAAYDTQLDRKVAIKLLANNTDDQLAQRTRLLREAQAMAKLSHPNVIQVHEVGEHEDQVYLVMEFVEGQTLAAWLEGQADPRPTPRAILDMFLQAGRGLAAAHQAGLVHRDFKPANVLVDQQGRARVVDFGLVAGTLEHGDDEPAPTKLDIVRALDVELTTTGTMLGTPAYMAPEQFLGAPVDARTDQFGFCVALFEALAGERPFAGNSVHELSINVSEGQRTKRRLRGLSRRASAAIERGLAVRPDARWASLDQLLTALAPPPRWRMFAWAGAALLPVVAAGGLWMAERYEQRLAVQAGALVTEQHARRELETEQVRSHNRQLLARASENRDNPQLALALLRELEFEHQHDHSQWLALTSEHVARAPVPTHTLDATPLRGGIGTMHYSADGRRLIVESLFSAMLWQLADADGDTDARALTLDLGPERASAIAFDPQQPERVAVASEGLLRLVGVDGRGPVVELPNLHDKIEHLEFSPDGRWLLARTGIGLRRSWRACSRDGQTVLTIALPEHGDAWELAFSPDGRWLAASFYEDRTIALWSLDDLQAPPRTLDAPRDEFATAMQFAPDSSRLAVGYRALGGERAPIRVWPTSDADAHAVTLLERHTDEITTLAFSPDGRRLLSSSRDRSARVWELDSGRSQVLHELAGSGTVLFSPSGDRIATSDGQTVRIWPSDASEAPLVLPGRTIAFAPSGDRFAVSTGSLVQLYDPSTAPERPPTAHRLDTGSVYSSDFGANAAIDASGRYLAANLLSGRVYVWDTHDWKLVSVVRHAFEGDAKLAIAGDGRLALASSDDDGTVSLWQGETGEVIGQLDAKVIGSSFSPDGRWLLVHGYSGAAKLWAVEPGSTRAREPRSLPHAAHIRALAFAPDGHALATSSADTIALWLDLDGDGASEPRLLAGHGAEISSLEFDASGTRLLSASDDGSARVWNIADGRQLGVFDSASGAVRLARFDPSGTSIVTATDDGARIWPIAGGEPLHLRHQQSVIDAVFSPDGRTLLTGTSDANAHRWQLDAAGGPLDHELAGNGSSQRLNSDRGLANVANRATDMQRVAFVDQGRSALVLTEDSVWIWDAAFSNDALLTWMWRSFPSCPTSKWRQANLGLEREAADAAQDRCEARVTCMRSHSYADCVDAAPAERSRPPGAKRAEVPATEQVAAAGIHCDAGFTRCTIARPLLEQLLADPTQLPGQTALVPTTRDGVLVGHKLFRVRPNSVPASLGVVDGDLLTETSLDGRALDRATPTATLVEQLRRVSSISLTLERDGQPRRLVIDVE